jgi:hypothetical protein
MIRHLVKTCKDYQLHRLASNVIFSGNTVLLVNQMESYPKRRTCTIRSEPFQLSLTTMQSGNKDLNRESLDCNEDERRCVLIGWRVAHLPSRLDGTAGRRCTLRSMRS